MSLHIEITDEAQHQLVKQKRQSIISAFISAILIFVLLGIVFVTAKIIGAVPAETDIIPYTEPASDNPDPQVNQITETQTPSAAPTQTSMITSTAPAEVSVPVVDVVVDSPNAPVASTIGEITIGGNPSGGVPDTMKKRCSLEDRLQRIKQSGGSEKYEEAVVKGLRWIQKQQQPDGSWVTGITGVPAAKGYVASMTGLAILTYLAHCETPYSEEFGESCQNAITFLVNLSKKNNGYLTNLPLTNNQIAYDHAIATYALAESYTFCQSIGVPIDGLREAVEKAGQIILKAQAKDGGWMYAYRPEPVDGSHPDLSVTGWNVQAVKALGYSPAKDKLETERAMKRAEGFLKKMTDGKGLFYYSGPGSERDTMNPVGVLSLQMLGLGHSKEAREGIKHMEKIKMIQDFSIDNAYFYYYAAQALINRGGPIWDRYGKTLGDKLVAAQAADGHWDDKPVTPLGPGQGNPNPFYKTALNILTLEVYYRFLPATGEGTRNTTSGSES